MENRTELYQVIIADFAAFISFCITASVPADYTAGCALIFGITGVIGLTLTGFYLQEKIIALVDKLKKEKTLRVNRKAKIKGKRNEKCPIIERSCPMNKYIIPFPKLKVKPKIKVYNDYCEVVKGE